MPIRHRRVTLLFVICLLGAIGPRPAEADIASRSASNAQEGDNGADSDQGAEGESGDAVGGQIVGVVASGDVSMDATNRSVDVSVRTGDAEGENESASFVGLDASSGTIIDAQDILSASATNVQEGDNELDLTQQGSAVSGDGIAGQVVGVVTPSGGVADIVSANTSEDVDVETGDADFDNESENFVGLRQGGGGVGPDVAVLTIRILSTNTAAVNPSVGNVSTTGLTCGPDEGDVCQKSYPRGTVLTLVEQNIPGCCAFDHWGGACSGNGVCQVTMTQDRTVSADFWE